MSVKIFQGVDHLWTRLLWVKKSDTKISLLELTPVGAENSDLKTLTLSTDSSKRKEKVDSDPSSSDSSSSEYGPYDDIKYRESKIKQRDKKKNHWKLKNRTRQTYIRSNLVCPMKAIMKARDAINGKIIGKINRTLSNYTKN